MRPWSLHLPQGPRLTPWQQIQRPRGIGDGPASVWRMWARCSQCPIPQPRPGNPTPSLLFLVLQESVQLLFSSQEPVSTRICVCVKGQLASRGPWVLALQPHDGLASRPAPCAPPAAAADAPGPGPQASAWLVAFRFWVWAETLAAGTEARAQGAGPSWSAGPRAGLPASPL